LSPTNEVAWLLIDIFHRHRTIAPLASHGLIAFQKCETRAFAISPINAGGEQT
jgi:hypothetical protein